MKKNIIPLVFISIYLISCNTNQTKQVKCCSSHKEAFDEFSAALRAKDFNRLRILTNGVSVSIIAISLKITEEEVEKILEK